MLLAFLPSFLNSESPSSLIWFPANSCREWNARWEVMSRSTLAEAECGKPKHNIQHRPGVVVSLSCLHRPLGQASRSWSLGTGSDCLRDNNDCHGCGCRPPMIPRIAKGAEKQPPPVAPNELHYTMNRTRSDLCYGEKMSQQYKKARMCRLIHNFTHFPGPCA